MLLTTLLLEGEPDGAGAIAPDIPAAPPDDGQPVPAVEGQPAEPEGASQEPAPEGEGEPAPDPENAPADLSDDAIAYLRETYGDKLIDPQKIDEIVDQRLTEREQEQRKQPQADPFWHELTNSVRETYGTFSRALEQARTEGVLADPEGFEAAVQANNAYTGAAERRAAVHAFQGSVSDLIGLTPELTQNIQRAITRGSDLKSFDPLHVELVEAIGTRENVSQNARRLLGQGQLDRAGTMDAGATGVFIAETLRIALAKGEQSGAESERKKLGPRVEKATTQASTNVRRELEAALSERTNGAQAQRAAASAGKPASSGPLTLEEAQTLPIEELKRRTSG